MKLTIIAPDKAVYINGVSYSNLNLNGIPLNIRVLQWQDTEGHIEYNDGTINETINDLPSWAMDAKLEWEVEDKKYNDFIQQEATKLLNESQNLTDAQKLTLIRNERNNRLSACDWTQVADVPSTINKESWATYRQALRDLPSKVDINNPIYPIPPSA